MKKMSGYGNSDNGGQKKENIPSTGVDNNIKEWNPMLEAYNDKKFNSYKMGPGANLPLEMHAGNGQKYDNTAKRNPFLVFRNVPKNMSKHALDNMCAKHGKLVTSRFGPNKMFFAEFQTVADMESAFRNLDTKENHKFGIHVYVGKHFEIDNRNTDNHHGYKKWDKSDNFKNNGENRKQINLNRKIPLVAKMGPLAKFSTKPIVSAKDYNDRNNNLQAVDPKRYYLIESDAHGLEHENLAKPLANFNAQTIYKYRTGGAYAELPEKEKENYARKSLKNIGNFNSHENAFQYASSSISSESDDSQRQMKFHNPIFGQCFVCKISTDLKCSRCYEFFCGTECQKKAWPSHRYICGKPKEMQLIPPPEIFNEATTTTTTTTTSAEAVNGSATNSNGLFLNDTKRSSTNLIPILPKNGSLVKITSVIKINVVFIRSISDDDELKFLQTISEIQSLGNRLQSLTMLPKLGQIVLTKFGEQYNRAMVLNNENLSKISINYIDYGNLDTKTIDELYWLPQKFCQLPRFAIPVILKFIPEHRYMIDGVRQFMYSHINDIEFILKYIPKKDLVPKRNVYQVELIDRATNQNFNRTIAGFCELEKPKFDDHYSYFDLERPKFPIGKNIELVITDNSCLLARMLSCTLKPYAAEIKKFEKDLQEFGEMQKDAPGFAPGVDQLCLVRYRYDGKWYRGRCRELNGDGFPSVHFIDYGTIQFADIDDIRPYSPIFNYPVYTRDVDIIGLPEFVHDELRDLLFKLLPVGMTINCDFVKYCEEDDCYQITILSLLRKVKSSGCLQTPELTISEESEGATETMLNDGNHV